MSEVVRLGFKPRLMAPDQVPTVEALQSEIAEIWGRCDAVREGYRRLQTENLRLQDELRKARKARG